MLVLKQDCIAGAIRLESDNKDWQFSAQEICCEDDLQLIRFSLKADKPAVPPAFFIQWDLPQTDMQFRWIPGFGRKMDIPADWGAKFSSNLAASAPVALLGNQQGNNRLLFAVSEAMRHLTLSCGVREETCRIICKVDFFEQTEAPLEFYEFTLRIDMRNIFYADAVRDAFAWFETFPEYRPAEPPDAAFDPIYSAWYSYHQNVHDHEMAAECRLAKPMGMGTIIVDDGWQTDDTNRGYGFCGDWKISPNRFPDMAAHVDEVHRTGMKYMIWYSVPFIGCKSENYEKFKGKYLYSNERLKTSVLDPRFPEVREFLISTWENAVRNWHLDGLKLDFIDSFYINGEDPAARENYAGRDIKALPLAVDALLSGAMKRLNAVRPGLLVEFRQSYIGPAIRKYGNMLRAGDCPADCQTNRIRTIELRLTSGRTAVHSDMLEWNMADSAESAALQFLNILFSVPQISVKLAELPDCHSRWLKFWLKFWLAKRDLLMKGTLTPLHPDLNYPVVTAENDRDFLAAVYAPDQVISVPEKHNLYIVNASEYEDVIVDLDRPPKSVKAYNVYGSEVPAALPKAGLNRIEIPNSGLFILHL